MWTIEAMVEIRFDATTRACDASTTGDDRPYTGFEQAEHGRLAYQRTWA
jgi:hypothetical protein